MGLRSTVATLTIVVTVVALLVAGSLIVVTTTLHRTATAVSSSLESIRIARGAQHDLLIRERVDDPILQREFESELRSRFREPRNFAPTEEERIVLDRSQAKVEAYLAVLRDPNHTPAMQALAYTEAYAELDDLIHVAKAQAEDAQLLAERWDWAANGIGFGAGTLVIALSSSMLVWLKRRAFEPIIDLANTMERFGHGDHDARAAERGPRELREMCRRFNEMASSIAAQRHAQMAFLGGVAHDLRNPLSTLQMAVALLLANRTVALDPHARQAVERISRQLKRMNRMLGDFLDGAKIEAGVLDLRVELHDARELVEEIVGLFEGISARHALTMELPDEPAMIFCDRLRVEQVLINLISNAIKYSPEGGIVNVALEIGVSEVELRVTDHGVGISDASVEGLFEPFRRAGVSSETVPGVGLGLYVVRKIVEAHQGRIAVESTPGRGSTFRVFLPLDSTPIG